MPKQHILKFIIENGILINGKYDARKARKYIKDDIKTELFLLTPKCQSNTVAESIYWLVNKLDDFTKSCKTCNNPITTWHSWNIPYKHDFCSKRCSVNNPKIREKIKKTNQQKYGVDYPAQSKTIQHKMHQTSMERYGVKNVFELDEYQQKAKNTIKETYGVDNVSQNEEIKNKKRETSLKNYGVEYPAQSKEQLNKRENNHLIKYGVKHPRQRKEINDKINQTVFERYGVTNVRHIPGVNDKIKECYNKKFIETYPKIVNHAWIENELISRSVFELSKEIGCPFASLYSYIAKNNIPFTKIQSYLERDIKNLLTSKNIKFQENTRKIISPKELDFYIPEKKFAIELNGIYWHSELAGTPKNYHLEKTISCLRQNINLIHINETDMILKKDIVYSRIEGKLGLSKMIYARKCSIKQLSRKERNLFFNTTHMQGDVSSNVAYGLYNNNQLVASMSFGKARFNKKYEWEILRFSNTLNTTVVGGASRLFKHFIKNHTPKSIITYADRRWGEGKFYNKLGFTFSHSSDPNYFYFKNNDMTLYPRNKFQKHKLSKLLETFDPSLTEWENMKNNKWNRIWDCGNNVYTYDN